MTEDLAARRAPDRATITLRERRDADGSRRLSAERRSDGSIVIEGHDIGPGVERVVGAGLTEYEWAWVAGPDAVPAVVAALGGRAGDDPLPLLAAWYAAHGSVDPGSHLREAGVAIELWSRVGD